MLTTAIMVVARVIADLETALATKTLEASRATAKAAQLEELIRRQALMIKNLVNEQRGDANMAGDLATLQIENAHLRKRLEAQPAPRHAS